MGGLLGGRTTNGKASTIYANLQVQTSTQGVCIPIMWGVTRLSANIFWYNDFMRQKAKSGKGGGSKGGASYTYKAALMMGLCEGPIALVANVWIGSDKYALADSGWGVFGGYPGELPWAYLTSMHPDQALSYPNLAYVASTSFQLGSSASTPNNNFEVQGRLAGGSTAIGGSDAEPQAIILDYLTNTQYGYGLDPATIGDMSQLRNYTQALGIGWSPLLDTQEQGTTTMDRWASLANCWFFWDGLQFQFLPLGGSQIVASGYTFVPVTTPVADLGYDDFVVKLEGDSPVTVERLDPLDGYNSVQIDVRDRNNDYSDASIRWEDQASIDDNGRLQSNVVQAKEICRVEVGYVVAALIGQRLVNIRNTYKFTLGPAHILLMVGDIVTLTEPLIGLSRTYVRIRELQENEAGEIEVTAEECPQGQGAAPTFTGQAYAGTTTGPGVNAPPPSVNPPAIVEPSPALTQGVAQVWVAASGGANWGGCQVWLSFDNLSYTLVGEIDAESLQGTTTTVLPVSADPDTADTLGIDLTESLGVMPATATHANADALQTLALLGSELVAYGSATPTGSHTANLSYIRRGAYGTAVAAHSAGTQFSRLDPSVIFAYDLPLKYVGQTLWFKLCSINQFGSAPQDISEATAYSYVPTGVAYTIGSPGAVTLSSSRVTQADGTTILTMSASWVPSAGPLLGSYEAQSSVDAGASWQSQGSPSTTNLTISPAVPSTNYLVRVRAVSQSGMAISAWSTSASVGSGPLVSAVPAAVTGLTATAANGGYSVSWTGPSDPTVMSYTVWQASGSGQPFSAASRVLSVSAPASSATVTGQLPAPLTVFVVATNAAGAGAVSSAVSVTPTQAPVTGQPYDILGYFTGAPAPGSTLYRLQMVRAVIIPASMTGSLASCTVAPSSSAISLLVRRNGSTVGTITWAAGSTTASFAAASAVAFAAGDLLEVDRDSTVDAGFSGPSWSIVASR